MRSFSVWVAALIAILPVGEAGSQQPLAENDAVAGIFTAEGVDATLVVATAAGRILHVYNEPRAKTRFSPASTFKIPNTLIGLDSGSVSSSDSTFIWDGKDRGVSAWNRDHTLKSAFAVSCVWCYQQIAREVGAARYESALADIDYGNQQVGEQVDQFWLNNDLQISAIEQIAFLRNVYNYSLPFANEHVDILKDIMLVEETPDYVLRAKSGWTGGELAVGWYVGFVEKGEDAWLFAMNMKMERAEQAPLRRDLTVRSLQAIGIL